MYSREFSDRAERRSLPPHYDGTALRRARAEREGREETPPCQEDAHERCEPQGQDMHRDRERKPRTEAPSDNDCRTENPPHGGRRDDTPPSFLRGLLHPGEDGGELLLLLVAVLLLADGCEDEYLPFLLLLLLIIN